MLGNISLRKPPKVIKYSENNVTPIDRLFFITLLLYVPPAPSTVNILTILNGNNHFWTSFKKRDNGSFERNDIKIIFTRKTK